MSGLDDAARAARKKADTSLDRGVHAVANALEGALAAERREPEPEIDLTGIPEPAIAAVVIRRPNPRHYC
jgi:hypothetical protein